MRTLIIASFFVLVSFGAPVIAFAQADGSVCDHTNAGTQDGIWQNGHCVSNGTYGSVSNTTSGSVTLINPLKSGTSLEGFLQSILQFIIRIGAIVVVLMIIFVGYKFVTARGAPAKIEEAKGMLLWTVIGALVLLGAQAIATAIQATVTSLGG